MRRPRKYTILIQHDMPTMDLGERSFMSVFAQSVQIDPHTLWCAPESDIKQTYWKLA